MECLVLVPFKGRSTIEPKRVERIVLSILEDVHHPSIGKCRSLCSYGFYSFTNKYNNVTEIYYHKKYLKAWRQWNRRLKTFESIKRNQFRKGQPSWKLKVWVRAYLHDMIALYHCSLWCIWLTHWSLPGLLRYFSEQIESRNFAFDTTLHSPGHNRIQQSYSCKWGLINQETQFHTVVIWFISKLSSNWIFTTSRIKICIRNRAVADDSKVITVSCRILVIGGK